MVRAGRWGTPGRRCAVCGRGGVVARETGTPAPRHRATAARALTNTDTRENGNFLFMPFQLTNTVTVK